MSNFKKFCDLVGGIGAFFISIYFIGKYMSYDPGELEEGMSKLDMFFSIENGREYRQYVILLVLFIGSIAISRIFKKLPALTLCVSVLPLLQVMNMFFVGKLYDYAPFCIFVAVIHLVGNIYELSWRDRADDGKRAFVASALVGALATGASLIAIKLTSFAKEIYDVFLNSEISEEEMEFIDKLELVGIEALAETSADETGILLLIALTLAFSVVLSLCLRGVHFIDGITAAIPFVIAIYAWHTERLNVAPMLVLVTCGTYLATRITLVVRGES